MADRLPATVTAASAVETKPRRGLPNLARHLEPERLLKQHGAIISRTIVSWIDVATLSVSGRDRERVERELEACPSLAILSTVSDELSDALAVKPDRTVVQASVAVLFDSRVRGPQNPEMYLEALVYDLVDEGFPPAVVVAACQTLRREQVFTPEIAEVIAACRKKVETYRAVARIAGRLLDSRMELEDRLRVAAAKLTREAALRPMKTFDPKAEPGEAG